MKTQHTHTQLEVAAARLSFHRGLIILLSLYLALASTSISALKQQQQQTLDYEQQPQQPSECKRVYFGPRELNNICCQCNELQCDQDSLTLEWPRDDFTYLTLTSDKSGARFKQAKLTAAAASATSTPQPLASNGAVADAASDGATQWKQGNAGLQTGEEEEEQVKNSIHTGTGTGTGNVQSGAAKGAKAAQQQQLATMTEQSAVQVEQEADYNIQVLVNRHHQQVVGYGGAFTDSASQMISSLSAPTRLRLLQDYFGPNGLRYNMGRVPISGTDMSSRPYSYDDLPKGEEDHELKKFSLQAEDLDYKIPLINEVNEMRAQFAMTQQQQQAAGKKATSTGKSASHALKLIAASWSAPAWMKSNDNLVQGKLKPPRSGRYYDAYARYVVKFLHEYEKHNISMWALSPQNEPLTPKRVGPVKINFNSVNFDPEEMLDFLEDNLVPALVRAGKTPDKLKLFLWDDTLDGLEAYQKAALSAPNVRQFAHGLALHWYSQGLHEIGYKHLYEARHKLPAQYCMMSTEASFIGRPRPGDWSRGQRYARDMIENLRAGSVGWIDWNLALNMSGGPSWSHNYLDSAVLIDPERDTYYKNPMFYALGHLSRFIEARSEIVTSNIIPRGQTQPIQSGAIQDELAVVAAELEEPAKVQVQVQVQVEGDAGKTTTTTTRNKVELRRRIAMVLLNRVAQRRRVRLTLVECVAKEGQVPLELDLSPNSITSLAFLC